MAIKKRAAHSQTFTLFPVNELSASGNFVGMAVAIPLSNILTLLAFAVYLIWLNLTRRHHPLYLSCSTLCRSPGSA
jgi:hypothetical protein